MGLTPIDKRVTSQCTACEYYGAKFEEAQRALSARLRPRSKRSKSLEKHIRHVHFQVFEELKTHIILHHIPKAEA